MTSDPSSSTPDRPPAHEAWVVAGSVDGVPAQPAFDTELGGIPYLMRLVCDLATAGAKQVFVLWTGPDKVPDISAIASERRVLERCTVTIARTPPDGPADRPVLVARADRVYHRDVPKLAVSAWRSSGGTAGKVRGDAYDAVIATTRATAVSLWEASAVPGGWHDRLGALERDHALAQIDPPYLGFCVPVRSPRELRAARGKLVSSLRKSADGIAAKLLNRRISLPITRLIANTSIHPNQVTLIALACALAGGAVISRGGYLPGLVGMLLVELGSIIDGIDGELARLRFQFSRRGQWLDTIVDDIGNIAYASGVMVSLHAAGVGWAVPVGLAAIGAFVLTQTTQYYLILRVYRSGDLAAIPWAFQSSEFLSQRPRGILPWIKATVPKMLKRDFVVTMFVVFAAIGYLEIVLGVFAAGAFTFFVVLFTQLARNRASIADAAAAARQRSTPSDASPRTSGAGR